MIKLRDLSLTISLFCMLCVPFASVQVLAAGDAKLPVVRMKTNVGDIDIEFYPDKAPKTVENFLNYVKQGYFNGLIFHRVIPGFVIQGGGFEKGMKKRKSNTPITNEADNGLRNLTGTLSMARTGDPHSGSSQFFINLADNRSLDHTGKNQRGWGYAVFAKVIKGMDTVNKIAATPTGTRPPYSDVPKTDMVILDAQIISK